MKPNPTSKRLSPKQIQFFRVLFTSDCTFAEALNRCNIRMRLLDRWLTEPRFLTELRRRLNMCKLQAQVDTASAMSQATQILIERLYSSSERVGYQSGRDLLHASQWIQKSTDTITRNSVEQKTGARLPSDPLEKYIKKLETNS